MKVFGLVGWSGSGKTVLIEALLPLFIGRGLTVSTLKHTHHRVDLDRPGKDSFRHRTAGAAEVALVTPVRWTVIHEVRNGHEPGPEEVIARMTPVDLLLIEGFKSHAHAKLEVHRADLGKPLLAPNDPAIVAVATDRPLPGLAIPVFDRSDIRAIAGFIAAHLSLAGAAATGAMREEDCQH